jgi:hypothetical protein
LNIDNTPCDCTPRYDNGPTRETEIRTIHLVCAHAANGPYTTEELYGDEMTFVELVAVIVLSWSTETGRHVEDILINWGCDDEYRIALDNRVPTLMWNRCPVEVSENVFSFHSTLSVKEWAAKMIHIENAAQAMLN